jgi:crotonobetainyl-CoA:carnitine CoA-transferase CaiB-like acyl-CoA transferase
MTQLGRCRTRSKRSANPPDGLAAALGEHTEEVLGSLGFSAGDMAGLRERKVI